MKVKECRERYDDKGCPFYICVYVDTLCHANGMPLPHNLDSTIPKECPLRKGKIEVELEK